MSQRNSFLNKVDLDHILTHTQVCWESMTGKRIFITGGTGFFGKWLLFSFLYNNYKFPTGALVTVLTRNIESFLNEFPTLKNEQSLDFVEGDILTCNFPNKGFDYIIHAATDADAKLNTEDPLLMLETITKGTKRILDFAKTQPLKSFLLTSSGAVYGKQPSNITHVKEDDGFYIDVNNTESAYAEGKRIAELYCSIYYKQHAVPVKIARCYAFVGPFLPLNKHFAIGNFILNGLQNQDIIIRGDGSPYRSYMYAADLAIWLWNILLTGENNTPYNVGSDDSVSIKETAEAVALVFNNRIKYSILGEPTGQPVQRYVPNIDKAVNTLNVKASIKLTDAIKRTVAFYEHY